MLKRILFILLISVLASSEDTACVYPGQCTPPNSRFKKVADILPRYQWTIDGGFCGSLSIQTIALTYGAYISQDLIRKQAPSGGGNGSHGNGTAGYEILPANLHTVLTNLKFLDLGFDHEGTQQPQAPAYMQWMKWNLVQGNPVIAFVMCKGDSHDAYGLGPFDHIEPFWGVYSESELNPSTALNETNVYPDDWIVHGSNYMPDGEANLGYFRKILSLPDTTNMTGNCKLAQENLPDKRRNEMFPCINDQQNYGAAVRGLIDPANKTYPLELFVSVLREPNVRIQEDMKEMFGTIKITGLPLNGTFTIWRFDKIQDYPTDSNFTKQMPHTKTYDFVGEGQTYQWIDKDKINSDGATYYACTDRVS